MIAALVNYVLGLRNDVRKKTAGDCFDGYGMSCRSLSVEDMNMPSLTPLIDRTLDHLTRVIEVLLALAFIVGVSINFINVIGRYLFGFTYLGADEVQIYIMIWMAFLGAAVLTWRN